MVKNILLVIIVFILLSCSNEQQKEIPYDELPSVEYDGEEFMIMGPYMIPSESFNELNKKTK